MRHFHCPQLSWLEQYQRYLPIAQAIARLLANGPGYSIGELTRAEGYAGVDGPLALMADGQVRRGLAVFRVQRGGAQLAEPAPSNFGAPGF